MWNYEKRLQFPVNIKEPNAKLAVPTGKWVPACAISPNATPCPIKKLPVCLRTSARKNWHTSKWWQPLCTSLPETFPWRKSKPAALLPTTRTILSVSGPRLRAVCPSMPVNSRAKATLSPIYLRIWLRSKHLSKHKQVSSLLKIVYHITRKTKTSNG